MEKTEKDWREELHNLAKQILEMEENSSLEELKLRCGKIFEALVILQHELENSAKRMSQEPAADEKKEQKPDEMAMSDNLESENPDQEEDSVPSLSDLFVPTFGDIKEDMSQKEEFKDTVSLEETENLFSTPREEPRQLSLNDKLVSNSIHFGLNDRIAFVNKLFNFSQSDFNKVVDRLNDMSSFEEARHFIQYQVKTNYNWKGKEDLEERFMEMVERKFMS